jgi:hypothetical protein
LLDWEDPLPEDDYDRAGNYCEAAQLILCFLGTSLRIELTGALPTLAATGKFVICNLQQTPKDNDATLIIRAKIDQVMADLMQDLGYSNNQDDWNRNIPSTNIERLWKNKMAELQFWSSWWCNSSINSNLPASPLSLTLATNTNEESNEQSKKETNGDSSNSNSSSQKKEENGNYKKNLRLCGAPSIYIDEKAHTFYLHRRKGSI